MKNPRFPPTHLPPTLSCAVFSTQDLRIRKRCIVQINPETLKEIGGVCRDMHTQIPRLSCSIPFSFAAPQSPWCHQGSTFPFSGCVRTNSAPEQPGGLFFMAASNTSLSLKIAIFQALLPGFGKHKEHRSPACPARSVLGWNRCQSGWSQLSL